MHWCRKAWGILMNYFIRCSIFDAFFGEFELILFLCHSILFLFLAMTLSFPHLSFTCFERNIQNAIEDFLPQQPVKMSYLSIQYYKINDGINI
jgi:hypothetical protein